MSLSQVPASAWFTSPDTIAYWYRLCSSIGIAQPLRSRLAKILTGMSLSSCSHFSSEITRLGSCRFSPSLFPLFAFFPCLFPERHRNYLGNVCHFRQAELFGKTERDLHGGKRELLQLLQIGRLRLH